MKILNKSIVTLTIMLGVFISCNAQVKNAKTEIVKIYGNCGMCEKNIETAAFVKKEAVADWDVDSKMATITYDSTNTTLDEVLKRIAYAGYDSDMFLAPDETYNNLHGCCQYERPKHALIHNADATDETVTVAPDTNVATEEVVAPNLMGDVYSNYFLLKDALTKDDWKTTSAKAKILVQSVSSVEVSKMNANQKEVWTKVVSNIKTISTRIFETNDLSIQRENFALLSEDIHQLLEVFKADGTIYYQHCPMYNDGKGAHWLSEESAIKNPYYGSAMLTCGSTKETLK